MRAINRTSRGFMGLHSALCRFYLNKLREKEIKGWERQVNENSFVGVLEMETLRCFPRDIWLLFGSYCNYKDLVSLTRTTKTLYSILNNDRQLWLELLDREIVKNKRGVIHPSLKRYPRRLFACLSSKRCFSCGEASNFSTFFGCYACKKCTLSTSKGLLTSISATLAKKNWKITDKELATLKSKQTVNEYRMTCNYYLLMDVQAAAEQLYGDKLKNMLEKTSSRSAKIKATKEARKAAKQQIMDKRKTHLLSILKEHNIELIEDSLMYRQYIEGTIDDDKLVEWMRKMNILYKDLYFKDRWESYSYLFMKWNKWRVSKKVFEAERERCMQVLWDAYENNEDTDEIFF